MKKKIAKVLCLTMLLVSLASSAVVAAPASVQECKHEWGSAVFLETVEEVVNGNHQCTICGLRISLLQKKDVDLSRCKKCNATIKDKVPNGPIYSTHPCYN